MSAYMVSKNHIHAIVEAAINGPKGSKRDNPWYPPLFGTQEVTESKANQANQLGTLLIAENLKSIHARYPGTINHPYNTHGPFDRYWERPYIYDESAVKSRTAVEAIKLIRCYEYQSCEHEGWEDSDAGKFCRDLIYALLDYLPGMSDASWEID